MKSVALKVKTRAVNKRPACKKMRKEGRIPAVIYGRKASPSNLEVNEKEMDYLIHHSVSENILVDLEIEGDSAKRLALIKDVQHHVLSGKVLHVDFQEVDPNQKVTIQVPIESTGEAAGVKTSGGVLEHVLFKAKVTGLPKDLPEIIIVDVTQLQAGSSIHLGDIAIPDGVEIVGDKTATAFSIAAPRVAPVEAAAEPAQDAKKGKKAKK